MCCPVSDWSDRFISKIFDNWTSLIKGLKHTLPFMVKCMVFILYYDTFVVDRGDDSRLCFISIQRNTLLWLACISEVGGVFLDT